MKIKEDENSVEILEENQTCSYYDDKISDMRYKYIKTCTPDEHSDMLERGWRRFGHMHFVPECKTCNDCTTIRIDIEKKKFTKSQKRVVNKNKDTEVYIQEPSMSVDHLNLFDKYHSHMHDKKQWKYDTIEPDDYYKTYVSGANTYGKEILFMRDEKLIGVALVDILESGMSSIYCYYDHDYEHLSLGKYSILTQMSLAKQYNIPYLYLGYWIKDHYSMGYKEDYKPFEVLTNRAALDEETIWRNYE
ncbi:MAG: arginyltransferase [Epsilonproteobacteria bacterium]|nr:MAG: arginyltransferase [Campylobacterota bacterium]